MPFKQYKQLENISTATLLEESRHLRYILYGVLTVTILVFVLILWAAIITIDETAATYGTIVPKGQVQIVQHLEGGIVQAVLVEDGQHVKKGQVLIKFNPSSISSELLSLRSREINFILNMERLRAYAQGKKANVLKWSDAVINSKYNTVKNKVQIDKLLKDELNLLASQNKSRIDQEDILKVQIERRKEELTQAKSQLKVWEKHVELLTQEFNMYVKLRKNNYVSHKDYLTVLRELNRAKGEQVRLESKIKQTRQIITESEKKLQELDSDLRNKALKELDDIGENLLEVRHKIEKLEERLRRMNVKSPVTGIVKGLKVFPGNVVQPGGLLLEVVPFDRELVVESRINPRDIGYIKVGDPVKVKVLTYDFARFGSIDGKVTSISASTFQDKDGKPYYKATIMLAKQYIGSASKKKYLLPGMTVEANVITGQKTLLQYLLKPIHTSAGTAFKER